MAILAADARVEFVESEIPTAGRGFGLDAGQSAREAPVFRAERRSLYIHRADGIQREIDGKAACDGIDGLRRIDYQHALTLAQTVHVNFAVLRAHHTGQERQ